MVNECFKCGVSGEKALLFDAISEKGIVKICKKCSFDENIPIIKNSLGFQFKGDDERKTVYERLSRMSGFDSRNKKSEKELLKKQETSLRELVDKNFKSNVKKEAKPRPDLIDNFHWIIMRVRRAKKITLKQVAEAIAEPEEAIKMAEKGILPEDYKLVNKLENYFGINLRKGKPKVSDLDIEKEIVKQDKLQTLGFDPITTKTLTISDLQEMKTKRENEILERKEDYVFNEDVDLDKDDEPEFVDAKNSSQTQNFGATKSKLRLCADDERDFVGKKDKDDLSQKDMDDILFGRKRNDKK